MLYNTVMIIVVIAGGQGSRLWPLSKPNYPKHLLALTNESSLLQNTITRAEKLTKKIYIIPEASHVEEVKKQIPHYAKNILLEPARRGTANCIIFALAELKKVAEPNEVIVFLYADSHIGDETGFVHTMQAATKAASDLHKIVLVGVQPDYPATGFGYIKTGEELTSEYGQPVLKVEKFVEKPDEKTARQYLKSKQYLWNMGLFAGSIKTFEQTIAGTNKKLWEDYKNLNSKSGKAQQEYYLSLPNEAIDTALIEKVTDLAVVPGHFDWADIGSFRDLHEILKNGESNVTQGQVAQVDCQETLVVSNSKPIVTIGLQDMIVIESEEGILICPKDKSQLVKEGVEILHKTKTK